MNRKGFTLIELIVAMAVGLVIMAAVYAAMNMAQRVSGSTEKKVVTQQDTRAVLDLMSMEIRMASFNPTCNSSTWASMPSCPSMPGVPVPTNKGNKGIQVATRNKILVAMDLSSNGTIGEAGTSNEYIMYTYDGISTITRNISCSGNIAILGGTTTGTNVRNKDPNTDIPLFSYFDKSGTDITAAIEADQSKIANIRSITITIVADNEYSDLGVAKPRRMIYSTNFIVRNHVLSP